MATSSIEWTEFACNPTTGCEIVVGFGVVRADAQGFLEMLDACCDLQLSSDFPMPCPITLKVRSADGTEKTFELTGHDTFILGRMADCHLRIPDDNQVSQKSGPPMAVKVLLSRAQADERAVEQFKREMDVIAGLKHPHIVEFLTSGSDAGTFFFVMESLRSQARSHRHHSQRKPGPHSRPHAGTGGKSRNRHRQSPPQKSQRPLPRCRKVARGISQMTR
jgi:serine/threonine protein kinase